MNISDQTKLVATSDEKIIAKVSREQKANKIE